MESSSSFLYGNSVDLLKNFDKIIFKIDSIDY